MTRKKVKLEWIGSDSARKSSFKKRRGGLLKKVSELSILCGVSAFVIVSDPCNDELAVWPAHPMVEELVTRFQSVPENQRCKKMVSQETYLEEREEKMQEQLRKTQRKNKEMEMNDNIIMDQIEKGKPLHEFKIEELIGFVWLLEEKLKEIQKRVKYFEKNLDLNLPGNVFSPPREGGEFLIDYFSKEKGKQIEKNIAYVGGGSSTAMSDMRVPIHAYSGTNHIGLMYENFSGGSDHIELPHVNYGMFSPHYGHNVLGHPHHHGNTSGDDDDSSGSDLGMP